jgi:hypothetical protein
VDGGTLDADDLLAQIFGDGKSGDGDWLPVLRRGIAAADVLPLVHVVDGGLKLPDGLAPRPGSSPPLADVDPASKEAK